jgi:hypothetical protein
VHGESGELSHLFSNYVVNPVSDLVALPSRAPAGPNGGAQPFGFQPPSSAEGWQQRGALVAGPVGAGAVETLRTDATNTAAAATNAAATLRDRLNGLLASLKLRGPGA